MEGVELSDFDTQPEEPEFYDDEPLDYEQEYIPTNNVVSIDEVLQRRTSVRLNRNRVVTLRDLIRQLEFYEMLDKSIYDKETNIDGSRYLIYLLILGLNFPHLTDTLPFV